MPEIDGLFSYISEIQKFQDCSIILSYRCVKEWQTLIGALIASGAAIITVFIMGRQYNLQREALKNETQYRLDAASRKLRMAKAHMPRSLAIVNTAAQDLFRILMNRKKASDIDIMRIINSKMYDKAILDLRNSVEHIDGVEAEKIMELVRREQVLISRLEGHIRDNNIDKYRVERMAELVNFHYLSGRLFNFARSDDEVVEGSKERNAGLMNSFKNCQEIGHSLYYEEDVRNIKDYLERYYFYKVDG